jgi:hypothetical protein
MKWTKELDNQLVKLVNLGKKHSEIAVELNITKSSVQNRCTRLGVKKIPIKEHICNNCGNTFLGYVREKRKFCSNHCSNSFSNKNRKLTLETKKKISDKLKNKTTKKNSLVKNSEKNNEITIRKCRFCKIENITTPRNIICETCRFNYYKFYRPSCEFNFNIKENEEKFDMKLVENYGWYSPTNKGDNLNGVSKDHMYSVRDGFINKVDPEIIKHPANCRLILHKENNIKKFNSIISLEELEERIKNW